MELQLRMCPRVRTKYLERHNFYVGQVRLKIFGQFHDIEGEAQRYAHAEYAGLGSLPSDENADRDRVETIYALLCDLRKQMMLAGLAGLYHQWDKDLREFIERELGHYVRTDDAANFWKSNAGDVLSLIGEFGWDCRSTAFFPKIDACRLIVNVYKHGKGPALQSLAASYPEYFEPSFTPTFFRKVPRHEDLAVSEAQFDEIAAALHLFWQEFPERLPADC